MQNIDIKVKALVSIKHNGVRYSPGSLFSISEKTFNSLSAMNPPRILRIEEEIELNDNSEIQEENEIVEDESLDLKNTECDAVKNREDLILELMELDGVSSITADRLIVNGYVTINQIANSTIDKLILIKGIGKPTAKTIINSAIASLENK